jgi:hypothetical protein
MSRNRDGINIGEGAAFFLMERGEGAIHLEGVGESSDAHSMNAPDPEGTGAESSMAAAIEDAGLSPGEIDFINLHGTATRQNDAMESKAISRHFDPVPPCTSTKPYLGHTLGAAGAIEAGICYMMLLESDEDGFPGPTTPMGWSAGRGSTAASPVGGVVPLWKFTRGNVSAVQCVCLRGPQLFPRPGETRAIMKLFSVLEWGAWAPGLPNRKDWNRWLDNENPDFTALDGSAKPSWETIPSRIWRRCDHFTRIGLVAALQCCENSSVNPEEVQMVWATRHGNIKLTISLLSDLARDELLSPMGFANSVPNTAAAYFGILQDNTLPTHTICTPSPLFPPTVVTPPF